LAEAAVLLLYFEHGAAHRTLALNLLVFVRPKIGDQKYYQYAYSYDRNHHLTSLM
jgi:hypothetical protein